MTKSYQWYYDGAAIGGATGKTHTLTSGQTDSNLIECRTEVTYGTDSVAALAEYAAAAPSLDVTYYATQTTYSLVSGTTYRWSFTSVPTSSDRWLIAAVTLRLPIGIASVDIGGSAATDVPGTPTTDQARIAYVKVPTGTSINVDVDCGQDPSDGAVHLYYVDSSTLTVTDSNDISGGGDVSVNTNAGDFVIACSGSHNGGAQPTTVGVTEDYNVDLSTGEWMVSGHAENVSAETPRTVSITTGNANSGSAAASFGA